MGLEFTAAGSWQRQGAVGQPVARRGMAENCAGGVAVSSQEKGS